MPRAPTNNTPLAHCGMARFVHASGFGSPWYHVSRTAGMSPRAPYWYVADIDAGASSGCGGGPDASTVSGAFRPSAQNGRSFQWLPRSDIVPLPKSHHRYHFGPGTYTGSKARPGAGPSHRSQSSVAGGLPVPFGRSVTATMSPLRLAS